VAAEDEGEESEQMEQVSDHRVEILSGSAPTDQRLGRGRNLAKDSIHREAERPGEQGL
jgi:hypothetical protein